MCTFQPAGPGVFLWSSMVNFLNHASFANSDAGAFTKIAVFLQRPVLVRPDLAKIGDAKEATTVCILERILAWYNSSDREIVEWEIEFCFPGFHLNSKRGKIAELSNLFIKVGG